MKKLFKLLLCSSLLLIIVNSAFSQTTTTKTSKTTTKNKDVPPPPPPRKDPPGVKTKKADSTVVPPKIVKDEEVKKEDMPPDVMDLQDTKIEAIAPADGEIDRYMSMRKIDTVPPPQDELTNELRKMMTLTGSLNLGVQFAKSLQDIQGSQSVLPQEFFDRMYKEITTGDGKRWFENAIIKVYRRHLTLQDVKDLNAFYTTPTGKKYVSLLPVFLEESKQAGSSVGELIGMKIYQQLVEEGKLK